MAIVILDMKRFWLDRARIVAGLIQPLLYLFVLGAGLGSTSTMGTAIVRTFLPGTMGVVASSFSHARRQLTMRLYDRQIMTSSRPSS